MCLVLCCCYRSVYIGPEQHIFGTSAVSLWWFILKAIFSAPRQAITLLFSLLSFFRAAWEFLEADGSEDCGVTLRQFTQRFSLSPEFTDRYLVPLASSVWPGHSGQVLDLDAYTILRALADNYLLTFTCVTWYAFSGQVSAGLSTLSPLITPYLWSTCTGYCPLYTGRYRYIQVYSIWWLSITLLHTDLLVNHGWVFIRCLSTISRRIY